MEHSVVGVMVLVLAFGYGVRSWVNRGEWILVDKEWIKGGTNGLLERGHE